MGINALLFLVLYNLFPLCITFILLWKKWEYGCTWIKRDLFAQNQMFLVVIPLISRPNVHFNTSEKPWYEMGWWHSSFVHCPICQIQGSIKKRLVKKKKVFKMWLSLGQYVIFQGLRSLQRLFCGGHEHTLRNRLMAQIGGSVSYMLSLKVSRAHTKSVYLLYFQRSSRLCHSC